MAANDLPIMSFDALAPNYRWLEFVLAGDKLQLCRTAFLDDIPQAGNILLLGDSVLICDYGVAQVLSEGDTAATSTGMVGSPAYMAPECVDRKPSFASDQYSLAVTYVELRTGALPFRTDSYYEVIEAHRTGKLDLSRLTPAERSVIRKATSVEPKNRYATTHDMVRELALAVHGTATGPLPKWRQTWLLAGTLSVVVAGMTLLVSAFLPKAPAKLRLELQIQPLDAIVEMEGQVIALDSRCVASVDMKNAAAYKLRVAKEP